MLLTDVFIIDNLKVLEESKAKGTMKISGIFQRADEANNNKRVYSKALLEREVVKLADMIDNRRLLGELDHPSHDSVKLSNVSHLVTNLKMQGSEVLGEAELLNTPAGLTAQALIKGGVGIGISSRGLGTLSEGEDGTKNVNEDFKLVTFDLVADPSTRGAYPTLSESTETKEIYDRTMKQAISEKVFVQSLKDRLEEGPSRRATRPSRVASAPGITKHIKDMFADKDRGVDLTPHAYQILTAPKRVGLIKRVVDKFRGRNSETSSKKGGLIKRVVDKFRGRNSENSSTDFQVKYSNLNSLIEVKKKAKKKAKREATKKTELTILRDRMHREHGRPGETARDTQLRLTGGGGLDLTKPVRPDIVKADLAADRQKRTGDAN